MMNPDGAQIDIELQYALTHQMQVDSIFGWGMLAVGLAYSLHFHIQ